LLEKNVGNEGRVIIDDNELALINRIMDLLFELRLDLNTEGFDKIEEIIDAIETLKNRTITQNNLKKS